MFWKIGENCNWIRVIGGNLLQHGNGLQKTDVILESNSVIFQGQGLLLKNRRKLKP